MLKDFFGLIIFMSIPSNDNLSSTVSGSSGLKKIQDLLLLRPFKRYEILSNKHTFHYQIRERCVCFYLNDQ